MKIIQIAIVFSMLLTLYVSRHYSNMRIRTYVKMVFSFAVILTIIVSLWPSSTFRIAKIAGVSRGADLVFYVTTCGLIGLTGVLVAKFREQEIIIANLVRQIALNNALENKPYSKYK